MKDFYKKCLASFGYNKGNSVDVDTLVNEILPEIFSKKEKLHIQKVAEIEKIAMDKIKDKWEHLYILGYPEKPFPLNYRNDLNNVKTGIYEGIKHQQEKSCDELLLFLSDLKDKIDYFEHSVNQQSYLSEYIDGFIKKLKKQ